MNNSSNKRIWPPLPRMTPVANPSDATWCRNRFLMWAGAYGDIKVAVYANSRDDAFEHLVEWLDDNAPGVLHEALTEEDEIDMTLVSHTTLNNGNCIPSWEWGYVSEDTRAITPHL